MLHKNYITKNDVIITYSLDRKFLYSNMFSNIISFQEWINIRQNVKPENIIFLYHFSVTIREQIHDFSLNDFKMILKVNVSILLKIFYLKNLIEIMNI